MRSLQDPTHSTYEGTDFWNALATDPSKTAESSFFEATGEVGDVYLLHPLTLHSASRNLLRKPRVITNPPVQLREPFSFNRKEKNEYSLVELKTLKDLGMPDGLKDWQIVGERGTWVSQRMKRHDEMKRKELERLGEQ